MWVTCISHAIRAQQLPTQLNTETPPIDAYPIIPPSDTLLIRQQKLLIYNNSNTVSLVYTFYTAVGGITSKGKKLKLFQEFYFTGHYKVLTETGCNRQKHIPLQKQRERHNRH